MNTAEPRSPPGRDDDVTAEGRSDSSDGADAHPGPDEPTQADRPAHSGKTEATAPAIENSAISDARPARTETSGRIRTHRRSFRTGFGGERARHLRGADRCPRRRARTRRARDDRGSRNAAKADVIGVWARIHEGWIYVYDDGRVLSHPDFGSISERRLSPRGLDLVRRGTLAPQDLQLSLTMTTVPAEVWSDPIPDAYRPDRYAVCKLNLDGSPEDGDVLGDVGSIWRRLPAHVQALLRAGRILSFMDDSLDENGDYIGQDGHHIEPGPGVACFVLSPGQTRAVWAHTHGTGGLPRGGRRVADERHDLRRTGRGHRLGGHARGRPDPAPRRLGPLGRLTTCVRSR